MSLTKLKILISFTIAIFSCGFTCVRAIANEVSLVDENVSNEVKRLRGFAEHNNAIKKLDKERDDGFTEHLLQNEKMELVRERAKSQHFKNQKQAASEENSDDYYEDLDLKQRLEDQRLKGLKERSDRLAISAKIIKQERARVSEEEELGLNTNRPRFETRKRALFGAPLKLGGKTLTSPGSSGSGSNFGSGTSNQNNSRFESSPPPIDYSQPSNDYFPPPPPPPSFDGFDDFPPPPPPIEGNFDDFPPPPPTSDEGFSF